MNFHKCVMQISNNIQGATKKRLDEVLNIPISNGISKYLGSMTKKKEVPFMKYLLKSNKKN